MSPVSSAYKNQFFNPLKGLRRTSKKPFVKSRVKNQNKNTGPGIGFLTGAAILGLLAGNIFQLMRSRRLNKENQGLRTQNAQSAQQIRALTQTVSQLNTVLQGRQEQISSLQSEVRLLTDSVTDQKDITELYKKLNETIQQDGNITAFALREARETIANQQTELNNKQREIAAQNRMIELFTHDDPDNPDIPTIIRIQEHSRQALFNNTNLREEVSRLTETVEARDIQNRSLVAQVQLLGRQVRELRGQPGSAHAGYQQLQTQYETLQTLYIRQADTLTEMRGELAALRLTPEREQGESSEQGAPLS